MSSIADNSDIFMKSDRASASEVAAGVSRNILGYDERILGARVWFEKGAIGSIHNHHHSQMTYVLSGVFEFEVDGERKVLNKGDCVYIPPNVFHGAICLEKGSLLDVFSPAREDFLSELEEAS